jgi:hypothetical protein
MRQWLGLTFLALFAYALVGVYPVQFALREMAREEMRTMLVSQPSLGTIELTFPLEHGKVIASGFAWEEEHEFSFNNVLYDVVSSTVHGNTITFQCIRDEQETTLIAQTRAIDELNAGSQLPQNTSKCVAKFVAQKYVGAAVFSYSGTPVSRTLVRPTAHTATHEGFANNGAPPPRA